jgi:hypothetical protein
MTVEELIEELNKCPKDAVVRLIHGNRRKAFQVCGLDSTMQKKNTDWQPVVFIELEDEDKKK